MYSNKEKKVEEDSGEEESLLVECMVLLVLKAGWQKIHIRLIGIASKIKSLDPTWCYNFHSLSCKIGIFTFWFFCITFIVLQTVHMYWMQPNSLQVLVAESMPRPKLYASVGCRQIFCKYWMQHHSVHPKCLQCLQLLYESNNGCRHTCSQTECNYWMQTNGCNYWIQNHSLHL